MPNRPHFYVVTYTAQGEPKRSMPRVTDFAVACQAAAILNRTGWTAWIEQR